MPTPLAFFYRALGRLAELTACRACLLLPECLLLLRVLLPAAAGCEAPYVDPKTHLRYANTEAFKIARSLTEDEVQARLGIRNAQSVLK